jgi:hypothetical protein
MLSFIPPHLPHFHVLAGILGMLWHGAIRVHVPF